MLLLQDGWTALHTACHWGRTEVVKCLLTNGANLSATNKVGYRILLYTVYHNIHTHTH